MLANNFRSPIAQAALIFGTAVLCCGCGSGKKPQPTEADPVAVSVDIVPPIAVPGQEVTLVWRFELADSWHLYWAGRNDSGYPPRIDLELPDGWVEGGLQWPVPERYVSPGDILDHVYFKNLELIQKIGAPDDAPVDQDIIVEADIQWLACKEMCVPGRTTLKLEIPVKRHGGKADTTSTAAAMSRLPVPLPDGLLETGWNGEVFRIFAPDAGRLTFMPTDDCGPLVDLLADGQGPSLALRFKPKGGTLGPVRGLITIENSRGQVQAYRMDFPATLTGDAVDGG